jgi:hypothetical protein
MFCLVFHTSTILLSLNNTLNFQQVKCEMLWADRPAILTFADRNIALEMHLSAFWESEHGVQCGVSRSGRLVVFEL